MFGVPSIDERITEEKEYVRGLNASIEDAIKARNKHLSRVGELTLLKDVRDGKLLVLDLETMEPARIAFL